MNKSYKKNTTKDIAKERLKLIIVQDRSLLSDEKFEKMKEELICVIDKYFEIEKEDVKIEIQRETSRNLFLAGDSAGSNKRLK